MITKKPIINEGHVRGFRLYDNAHGQLGVGTFTGYEWLNKRRVGKNMRHALDFATKYPGWHTYATDRATRDAVRRLEAMDLVCVDAWGQYMAQLTEEAPE